MYNSYLLLTCFFFVTLAACRTDPSYCKNGGTCQSNDVTIWCSCKERFSGTRCQEQSGQWMIGYFKSSISDNLSFSKDILIIGL